MNGAERLSSSLNQEPGG